MYGIILESVRDGVINSYNDLLWKRIVQELKLPSEKFDASQQYDHRIVFNICECMAHILHEGTVESYLEFFGQDFVRYFVNLGFDKIFRVAGRTLRDFLYAIDQLHDSNRFAFPHMHNPLFHVTDENEMGATIDYKSVRHGFARFAIGGLTSAAKVLFQENIKLDIISDSSTKEYAHIVFWIQFNNKTFRQKRLTNYPSLPDLNGSTFFQVFPFSILMNSALHIHQMGQHIRKLFPQDMHLTGRPLDEVFRLIRPDIHFEWDKILSYGRHIVFLMENRIPLRAGSSGQIRLKGQMKYIESKNMLWFLCHPVVGSVDDMMSAGLHVTDLNLFDNTADLLITGIRQGEQIEEALAKRQIEYIKSEESKRNLIKWRKRSQQLLYSILPRHIVMMLQSGVQPNSISESHPLVTILFAYLMDFKSLNMNLDPARIIECLNDIINTFDQMGDNYDVFKVETKADASYMVVAGLRDRSHLSTSKRTSVTTLSTHDFYNEHEEEMYEHTAKNPLNLHQTEIIASLALDLLNNSKHLVNPVTNAPFKIKFGFHSGPAVGGIVGKKNIQYCLFGDTVNMASRLTTTSEIGQIQLSHSSYSYLTIDNRFIIEYRGQVEMKGKGTHSTYRLISKAKQMSSNAINKNPSQLKCPFSHAKE